MADRRRQSHNIPERILRSKRRLIAYKRTKAGRIGGRMRYYYHYRLRG